MHAPRSIVIDAMSPEDLHALRRVARAERGFDAVARRALRLGFLSATTWGRLDPEASLGLRLSEADALLALVRTSSATEEQRDRKARLVRAWREGGAYDPRVDAMLSAALAVDAMAADASPSEPRRAARKRAGIDRS